MHIYSLIFVLNYKLFKLSFLSSGSCSLIKITSFTIHSHSCENYLFGHRPYWEVLYWVIWIIFQQFDYKLILSRTKSILYNSFPFIFYFFIKAICIMGLSREKKDHCDYNLIVFRLIFIGQTSLQELKKKCKEIHKYENIVIRIFILELK